VGFTEMAKGPRRAYVIRADPWNVNAGPWWATLAQRVIERNHTRVLRVRTLDDDPFGPVLHLEQVDGHRAVPAAIERTKQRIHRGDLDDVGGPGARIGG
jgi:hypothetical protein